MTRARPVSVKQLPEKLSIKQGELLFREVESCLERDRPRVVLDCSKVRQLDSAGIHVLLACLEEAMKRNGDVKLAPSAPRRSGDSGTHARSTVFSRLLTTPLTQ